MTEIKLSRATHNRSPCHPNAHVNAIPDLQLFDFLLITYRADCRFAKPALVGPTAIGQQKLWRMEREKEQRK
jgi:hypothetical protein